ncbi:MAG: RagB/SusD family nutrient uptake outer membrane protein, partial [Cytophagaceae bacterium]
MKTIKQLLTIVCICLAATGCKETFLELKPISNPTADNFKSTDDFELAVNAAYSSLYVIYHPEGAMSYVNEQMSDNAIVYNIAGIQADKWQFKDLTLSTTNTVVYQFWQDYYKALFNANIVINKIDGASLDAAYKDGVKAQMMFLRALYYFDMVQTWGDVPIVTTPLTGEESYNVLRSPQSAVYDQIKTDLTFAIQKLPLASAVTITGRASKGAA